jgi:hypothetical protein
VNLEGSGRGLIKVFFRHLPGWPEAYGRISVRIDAVSAKVRIENLPNTNLQPYLYTE